MRQVIIEHVRSKEVRVIQVGIDWSKTKVRPNRPKKSHGIIGSPRILIRSTSWDCRHHSDTKCWKTIKTGLSKPKRAWQKHGETRRRKHGRNRWSGHPSAKVLNEMGRCIHPCVDWADYIDHIGWLMGDDDLDKVLAMAEFE